MTADMADILVLSQMKLLTAITALHYAYPLITFFYYVFATIISACTPQARTPKLKDQRLRRDVIVWLVLGVVCGYLIQTVLILVCRIIQKVYFLSEDEMIYLVSSSLVWGIQFLALVDSEPPVWYPFYVNWIIGVIFEVGLLALSNISHRPVGILDCLVISLQSLRTCIFVVLLCSYLALRNQIDNPDVNDDLAERQPLLSSDAVVVEATSVETDTTRYGATTDTDKKTSTEASKKKFKANAKNGPSIEHDPADDEWLKKYREAEEKLAKRLADGNWWTYVKGFSVFFPFIFPIHDWHLQFRAGLVVMCLFATNFLNILVPRQLGVITDALITGRGAWIAVAIYTALTFANSSACIGWLQFWLWQPVEQYSYNTLNTAAYSHVMNLSCDFHEGKEPSEIHQAVLQGKSITNLIDTICFQLIPMFIDLILVFAFLYYLFGSYMAMDLAITTLFYLYTTAKLVKISQARRRDYVLFWRKEWRSAYNSLDNWRVASYFNNIPYEYNRHAKNVKDQLYYNRVYDFTIRVTSAAQGVIMSLGLLGGCLLAVYQVTQRERSPGDFVILLSYWAQLRGPLAFFSRVYKEMSDSLMDAERLLEFFETKPTVVDKEDAKALQLSKGEVIFDKVEFSYDDRKPTLKGINFTVAGGSTIAFVGETGSGKSTILKLLDRFYDISAGSIRIDGQDIRDVLLKSLRDKIGVVPQDPTLFNSTIMNNVRYAKLNATDEEVHEACKLAVIHDKIMTLPDGYKSMVGSGGVKLSGGEKQRIAIARTILKQPHIVLLDEATSAVDTETEQLIQAAFKALCRGRTTFIVAHRLSTVMRADRIMVVMDGNVIEDGSHNELIQLKGKYFKLWTTQFLPKVEEIAERADTTSNSGSVSRDVEGGESDIILDSKTQEAEISKLEQDTEPETGEEGGAGLEHVKLLSSGSEISPCYLHGEDDPESSTEAKDKYKENDQKKHIGKPNKTYLVDAQKSTENGEGLDSIGARSEILGDGANLIFQGSAKPEANTNGCKLEAERPNFSFRHHSHKTEPSISIQKSDNVIIDLEDIVNLSFSESEPLPRSSKRRRVSAPCQVSSSFKAETRLSTASKARRLHQLKNVANGVARSRTGANTITACVQDQAVGDEATSSTAPLLPSSES